MAQNWYKRRWPEPSSFLPWVFVPILYRRAGRGVISGFLVIVFSVTYRYARPVERTIPSLATTLESTTCRLHFGFASDLQEATCKITSCSVVSTDFPRPKQSASTRVMRQHANTKVSRTFVVVVVGNTSTS